MIRFLSNKEIDKNRWNNIIDNAANGNICGTSLWLDSVCPGWNALVYEDYRYVLPYCSKGWIWPRVVQPPFTQQLGIYGNDISHNISTLFATTLQNKFKSGRYQGNTQNQFPQISRWRTNYIARVKGGQKYSTNHQRSIQKALSSKLELRYVSQDDFELGLKKNNPVYRSQIIKHFKAYRALSRSLLASDNALIVGAFNGDHLLAAVFFARYKRTLTYLLPFTHPKGRTLGAMHFLIDCILQGYIKDIEILDFEGSEIKGVAQFYQGFSAEKTTYPLLEW